MWYVFVIILGIFGFYYVLVLLPKKEKNQEYQQIAFRITKEIGNKEMRLVSVFRYSTSSERIFVLVEDHVNDSPTILLIFRDTMNSDITTEEDALGIIKKMPYAILYEKSNKSFDEYFQVHG